MPEMSNIERMAHGFVVSLGEHALPNKAPRPTPDPAQHYSAGYDGQPVVLTHIAEADDRQVALCSGFPFRNPHAPSTRTIPCPGCALRYREGKYGAA